MYECTYDQGWLIEMNEEKRTLNQPTYLPMIGDVRLRYEVDVIDETTSEYFVIPFTTIDILEYSSVKQLNRTASSLRRYLIF